MQCDKAFRNLRKCLIEAPVLAYPQAGHPFVLETDASGGGLGATVSSMGGPDSAPHWICEHGSHQSLSWKHLQLCGHSLFQCYIYGNDVSVYTGHAAVKAVLQTLNPSGKNARWWSEMYEDGDKTIKG